MRFGNKTFTAAAMFFAVSAQAFEAPEISNGMKELMTTAIIEGKSSGYLDQSLVKMFYSQTKSNEPIKIDIQRLQKYDERCAELGVVTHQGGIRDPQGKPSLYRMQFKISMCTDGSFPRFLESQEKERKDVVLTQCVATVKKGKTTGKIQDGEIVFKGCPKKGVAAIAYEGTCNDLGPGPNSIVKEFKFDAHGDLSIKMNIPTSCLNKKLKLENKWKLYVFEKNNLMLPKQLIGTKTIDWK